MLQLWIARPEEIAETPDRVALLEPYERAAQARLLDRRVGHEYFVTRLLARVALGKVLGEDPGRLRFTRTSEGKPEISPRNEVSFNLSNTRGLVVCLIGMRIELGVDVEAKTRGNTIVDLAQTVFTPAERASLFAGDSQHQLRHATQLWTLKESYIKARGKGMALPLESFGFTVDDAIELTLEPCMNDRAERWAFRTIELEEHIVSVCVERNDEHDVRDIRFLDLANIA
jgi:4'-phosphopantetheinyl transferase